MLVDVVAQLYMHYDKGNNLVLKTYFYERAFSFCLKIMPHAPFH